MRPLVTLCLVALLSASGCTAIDPFNFQFSAGGGDGGASDMTLGSAGFGEACLVTADGGCTQYAAIGTRPTSCLPRWGNITLPDNMCTRVCDTIASCADYAAAGHGALCTQAPSGGTSLCMPRCNPTLGFDCRTGYTCCNMTGKTTTEGICAPGC